MSPRIEIDDEVALVIRNSRRSTTEPDNEVPRRLLKLDRNTASAVIGRNAGHTRPRFFGELIEAGALHTGDTLIWGHRLHGELRAHVIEDGTIHVEGLGPFESPSAPLRRITGSEMNGWVSWRPESTGETLNTTRRRVQLEREKGAARNNT